MSHPRPGAQYIGDGVYVSVDPTGLIWLETERDEGWHEIALDASVYRDLVKFVQSVFSDA